MFLASEKQIVSVMAPMEAPSSNLSNVICDKQHSLFRIKMDYIFHCTIISFQDVDYAYLSLEKRDLFDRLDVVFVDLVSQNLFLPTRIKPFDNVFHLCQLQVKKRRQRGVTQNLELEVIVDIQSPFELLLQFLGEKLLDRNPKLLCISNGYSGIQVILAGCTQVQVPLRHI